MAEVVRESLKWAGVIASFSLFFTIVLCFSGKKQHWEAAIDSTKWPKAWEIFVYNCWHLLIPYALAISSPNYAALKIVTISWIILSEICFAKDTAQVLAPCKTREVMKKILLISFPHLLPELAACFAILGHCVWIITGAGGEFSALWSGIYMAVATIILYFAAVIEVRPE